MAENNCIVPTELIAASPDVKRKAVSQHAVRTGNIAEVKRLAQIHALDLDGLLEVAAEAGHLNILAFLHVEQKCRLTSAVMKHAVARLPIVQWLATNKCPIDEDVILAAAPYPASFVWLCSAGCPRPPNIQEVLVNHNQITSLSWILTKDQTVSQGCMYRIGFTGNTAAFHVLIMMVPTKVDWTTLFEGATAGNQLPFMERHYQQKIKLTVQMAYNAIEHGNLAMMTFLMNHECPCDSQVAIGAAHYGWLTVLHTLNCDSVSFPPEVAEAAAAAGHIDVLKWLHERKISWTYHAMFAAYANGHMKTFEWLKHVGCPMIPIQLESEAAKMKDLYCLMHVATTFGRIRVRPIRSVSGTLIGKCTPRPMSFSRPKIPTISGIGYMQQLK